MNVAVVRYMKIHISFFDSPRLHQQKIYLLNNLDHYEITNIVWWSRWR